MARLIGYVRVSTDDQAAHGHSLAQQPMRLSAYCAAYGHELVAMVEEPEGTSASVPLHRRAGGARVIEMLRKGAADGVLVYRIDRLFRSLLDGVTWFETARQKGWQVHSLSERVDTASAHGRLMLNIMLTVADHERDLASERTTQTMHELRRAGRLYGGVPYGCVERDGRLYRCPENWRVREWIVRSYGSAQESGRALSLRGLQKGLRFLGIAAPNGGGLWPIQTLNNLIKSHGELEGIPDLAAAPEALIS